METALIFIFREIAEKRGYSSPGFDTGQTVALKALFCVWKPAKRGFMQGCKGLCRRSVPFGPARGKGLCRRPDGRGLAARGADRSRRRKGRGP